MVASASTTSDPKSEITQNGVHSHNGATPKIYNQQLTTKSLPKGKYTLVGIDIDTTGRRLIDEIVQLSAFTLSDRFSQYIMPYMNLNPAARQRHQIRVITIGYYRMLKSTHSYKIIKSKSEIAALKDFLDWLEALKAKDNNSQGVILVYFEERKFIPYMVLESVKKYNLLDRFLSTVKSFANSFSLVKTNAIQEIQHFSLRKLSKHFKDNLNSIIIEQNNNIVVASDQQPTELKKIEKKQQNYDREAFDGSASVRAKMVYEVTLQLSNQDSKCNLDSSDAVDKMLAALQSHAQPIECDISELQIQNQNLERQNSFRPVFLHYFKTTLYHRVRAVKFRIILAEHAYDLEILNTIWSEKKRDGISEALQGIDELKPEDKTELTDLFDSYFDPAKTIIKPIVKTNNRRRNKRVRNNVRNNDANTVRSNGNEQGAGGDKQANTSSNNLPDSTTISPKAQRGKRNSRSYDNKSSPKSQTPKSTTANQTNNATAALATQTSPN